jgi:hypothetical protein
MKPMLRSDLLAYVATLPEGLVKIYVAAEDFTDTLGDDFQIAAEIADVFAKYAQRRHE